MQLKKCKMMRYLIRAIKYLLLLSALYVALVWAMYLLGAEPQIDPWLQIEAHLRADIGKKMVAVFVILAALYPRFGFMRKRIEGYTLSATRSVCRMQWRSLAISLRRATMA